MGEWPKEKEREQSRPSLPVNYFGLIGFTLNEFKIRLC